MKSNYVFSSGTGKSTLLHKIVRENCVSDQDKDSHIQDFKQKKKSISTW